MQYISTHTHNTFCNFTILARISNTLVKYMYDIELLGFSADLNRNVYSFTIEYDCCRTFIDENYFMIFLNFSVKNRGHYLMHGSKVDGS